MVMPKKRGSEIQIARGRLKGALQDLVAPSEEDVSEESDMKLNLPSRGRPPKKLKFEPIRRTGPVHESYVMKLFDRSLDLAKYDETTPLYPVCRAWITNDPKSPAIKNFRNRRTPSPEPEEKDDEIMKKYLSGEVEEIFYMPGPKQMEVSRVPSPLPEQKTSSKDNINLDYDLEKPLKTKEELLAEHRKQWVMVRTKWKEQLKVYEKKYSTSCELLEALCKK